MDRYELMLKYVDMVVNVDGCGLEWMWMWIWMDVDTNVDL